MIKSALINQSACMPMDLFNSYTVLISALLHISEINRGARGTENLNLTF